MLDIKGKLALITGGNRGIGKAIAIGFAKKGKDVVIVDLEVSEETINEIKDYGVKCHGYNFDLSKIEEIPNLINEIESKSGPIDILFNNAGTQKRHQSTDFPLEDWENQYFDASFGFQHY